MARDRFEVKDAQYARRVKSGQWPSDTCKDCKSGPCCKRTWHHSGDCCVHCGLDERGSGMKSRKNSGKSLIARWESKSGKHFVDLFSNGDGSYAYSAVGAGGQLGTLPSNAMAISEMAKRVSMFQPDAAKTPMRLVFGGGEASRNKPVGHKCGRCGKAYGQCPECGDQYPHGMASHCTKPACKKMNAPVDCVGCGLVVSADKKGVLTQEMELIPWRGTMARNPPRAGKEPLDRVLRALGLPEDADDLVESNQQFIWEMSKLPDDASERYADLSQDEIDEKQFELEREVQDQIYVAWQRAIESALESLAQDTGLGIEIDWKKQTAGIVCADWTACANQLRQIINGIGLTDGGRSLKEGMYIESVTTPRQYVLKLWFIASRYSEVYGTQSIKRVYASALESSLRNL